MKSTQEAGQHPKAINRIYRGDRVTSGNTEIDVLTCSKIIPIVVWYEESAGNHALRNYLQEKLDSFLEAEASGDARIGPLVLFTLQEMELFEELTTIESAETLLTDYADFVRKYPRDPASPFQVYVYHRYSGKEQPRGLIDRELESFLERIAAEHKKRVEASKEV